MPFELYYLPSYERCLKRLGEKERRVAGAIVMALSQYFRSGLSVGGGPYLARMENRTHRLVFKKLQGAIWEAYIEGHVRVLTRLEKQRHYLVFAGNHDQARQFLKEN